MFMSKKKNININCRQKIRYLRADKDVRVITCLILTCESISNEFLIFCMLILSMLIRLDIVGIEKMRIIATMQIIVVSSKY